MTRQELFDTMVVKQDITDASGRVLLTNIPARVKAKTGLMLSNKERYEAVAHTFPNPGLKWWLVAVLHEMECTQNFSKYLGNGQDLNKVTTKVPKGRGPFKSFEDGAIDAIKLQGLDKVTDWSIGNLLYILEEYNGYGYERYHNMNSPYIWSGSNHYEKGKYEEIKDVNGVYHTHFNPDEVSQQIGIALLLKELLEIQIRSNT